MTTDENWPLEAVEQPQLWEAVAARLRDAIVSGVLPAGSRLVERDLAARFSTSRGPVKDAIRQLAREGLVVELPRRGTLVTTLTARDLTEVYSVREALDVGACKALVATATDRQLQGLGRHLDAFERTWASRSTYLDAAEHDIAFHRALVELTGNRRLIAVYEQMLSTTMLLLRTAADRSPALQTVMEAWVHRDIVAALVARDAARAQAAVDAHYRHAEERLFAGFDQSA